MFLQSLMTSTDTGPTSRCTLLMSFLHARRHRRPPTLFIGPIPIGSFRIPSPSSLRLARRNVRNSSDYSTVRPRRILHCLAVSDSSSTDLGQQSSLSYMRMVARILLRAGTFHFLHRLHGSLISYTQHIGARSTSGRTDLYPATLVICTLQSTPIPHSAGNRRRDTMPWNPVPLCRQSEIQ